MSPVEVRGTWRHLFVKIVLKVTGLEATIACQYEQLWDKFKAKIDGEVHRLQGLLDKKLTMEDWRLLIIDAMNTLNEMNQVKMLCKV